MMSLTAFLHKIENRATSLLHKNAENAEVLENKNSEILTAMCVLIASLKETEKAITNAFEIKKINSQESESIVHMESEYLQRINTTSHQTSSLSPQTTLHTSYTENPQAEVSIDNIRDEMKALRKKLLSSLTRNLSVSKHVNEWVEEESSNIKLDECKRERSSDHLINEKEKEFKYDDDTRHAHRKTSKEINLGQYAESDAFDNNQKKRERFAKLMGGAKCNNKGKKSEVNMNSNIHHTTHAVSSDCLKTINNELIGLFDSALAHKGKKGLGAQEANEIKLTPEEKVLVLFTYLFIVELSSYGEEKLRAEHFEAT